MGINEPTARESVGGPDFRWCSSAGDKNAGAGRKAGIIAGEKGAGARKCARTPLFRALRVGQTGQLLAMEATLHGVSFVVLGKEIPALSG